MTGAVSDVALRRNARSPVAIFVVTSVLLWTGCADRPQEEKEEEPARPSSETEIDAPAPAPAPVPTLEKVKQATLQRMVEEPKKTGWISAVCLNVRGEPAQGGKVLGYLFKGDEVEIFEERDGWLRVHDAAGYIDGWVARRYVSKTEVASDMVIPDSYKEPRTPTVDPGGTARYLGSEACRECHSETLGPYENGTYGVWREHYHNDAYRTLTRPYTVALAKKRGIEDPIGDWRCLKCHVTAYGVDEARLGPDYREQEGVGCEACHGPGGDYLEPHQKASTPKADLVAMGFVVYSDIDTREVHCRKCHNELSPTYKPFNVIEFSRAIRHWVDEVDFDAWVRERIAEEGGLKEAEIQVEPLPILVAEVEPPPSRTPPPSKTPVTPPPRTPPPAKTPATPPPSTPPPAKTPVTPPPSAPPASQVKMPPPGKAPLGDARLADAPEELTLSTRGEKDPVYFPHTMHVKEVDRGSMAENCIVCHHTTTPGELPVPCSDCHKYEATQFGPERKAAYHGTCRDCHRELDIDPTTCSGCHVQP